MPNMGRKGFFTWEKENKMLNGWVCVVLNSRIIHWCEIRPYIFTRQFYLLNFHMLRPPYTYTQQWGLNLKSKPLKNIVPCNQIPFWSYGPTIKLIMSKTWIKIQNRRGLKVKSHVLHSDFEWLWFRSQSQLVVSYVCSGPVKYEDDLFFSATYHLKLEEERTWYPQRVITAKKRIQISQKYEGKHQNRVLTGLHRHLLLEIKAKKNKLQTIQITPIPWSAFEFTKITFFLCVDRVEVRRNGIWGEKP